MHTAAGVARSVALVLSIILSSVSGLANPVDIAASAHRHHTARRRRRAQYGAALALLIAKQYALDAEFQLLNPLPPLRTVYVRARATPGGPLLLEPLSHPRPNTLRFACFASDLLPVLKEQFGELFLHPVIVPPIKTSP